MRLFPSAGCDWLVVGLGNPGGEYQNTRHNAGFMTADRIAADQHISVTRLKFKGIYGELEHAGQKIILLKPQTFMNASGESAREALAWF